MRCEHSVHPLAIIKIAALQRRLGGLRGMLERKSSKLRNFFFTPQQERRKAGAEFFQPAPPSYLHALSDINNVACPGAWIRLAHRYAYKDQNLPFFSLTFRRRKRRPSRGSPASNPDQLRPITIGLPSSPTVNELKVKTNLNIDRNIARDIEATMTTAHGQGSGEASAEKPIVAGGKPAVATGSLFAKPRRRQGTP